jgi:hypothetical protein
LAAGFLLTAFAEATLVAGFLPAGLRPGVFLEVALAEATLVEAALAAGLPLVPVFLVFIFSPRYFKLSGNISSRCTIHNA